MKNYYGHITHCTETFMDDGVLRLVYNFPRLRNGKHIQEFHDNFVLQLEMLDVFVIHI